MKVGYIGNFDVPYSTESHVAIALERIGHTVVRIPEQTIDWPWAHVAAQRSEVDFVLWTHTHGFADERQHDEHHEYVERMAAVGIPTVGFHLDRWWGLERQSQAETEAFFLQDLVVTADGGHDDEWQHIGTNHVWMPPAVAAHELGRGVVDSRHRKMIGFVGGWRDYGHAEVWPWRKELVEAVQRRYGTRFRSWPRNGVAVRGAELNNIYASVDLILGDSCLAGEATHYWSDRVPETIGRGGFLLHPRVPGMEAHYPAELLPIDIPVGDLDGVFAVIDEMWAKPVAWRRELVEASLRHAEQFHTYDVRMRDVCALVEGMKR